MDLNGALVLRNYAKEQGQQSCGKTSAIYNDGE
jgi:hypothetical protein